MTFPLAVALPLGLAGAALVVYCVRQLVRRVKGSFVSRLPVAAKSRVTLDEAGTYILNIETPRMTLADLGMGALTMKGTVRDIETDREIPMRADLTGASVTGFSRTRRALLRFRVEGSGPYELDVAGIPDRQALAECSFVLSRPLGLAFVPLILGIVLGAGATILSVVLPLALRDTSDPLAASSVDACLDGVDASCAGLADTAEARCAASDADACHTLGLLTSQGRGMPENLPRAAELFQVACDGGVANGCVNLGWALQHGQGVDVDLDRAALAFQQACRAGVRLGCHNLGVLQYEQGRASDAIGSFQQACDLGHLSACHNLAALLVERGGQGDAERARTLYRRACDAGLEVSCQALEMR